MNKTLQRLGLAAVVGGLVAAAVPAQAATTHTMQVGSAPGASAGRLAFTQDNCQMTEPVKALNGTDTRIVDVASRAGQRVTISFTAAQSSEGWLVPSFWSATCAPTVVNGNPTQLKNRAGTALTVPAGSKWLIMEGLAVADIKFTISP